MNFNYPKSNANVCATDVSGTQGTVVNNPIYIADQIGAEIIKNGGIETNFIWRDEFSRHAAGLLFAVKTETYPDGSTRIVYTLKDGIGSGSKIKNVGISRRDSTCVVVWTEGTVMNTTTTLTANAAVGATFLILEDATSIGGISIPMTLILKDSVNGLRTEVALSSIDNANPDKVYLTTPLTVAIDKSACVYRGHYNPAPGCTNTYSNTVAFYANDKEYFSYFTRIIQTLKFDNKCLLNQTYLHDLLNGNDNQKESAAYKILQSLFSEQISEAMNQFVRSAFFHKNTPGNSTVHSQTYGLLEKMKSVHTLTNQQFFDLTSCNVVGECDAVNAENLINTFLKIVQSRAQLSPYSDTKNVIIGCNAEMLESVSDLRKYFEAYTGEVITRPQTVAREGDIISTRKVSFSIEDRGYIISFVWEPVFDELPRPFGLVMPENTMGVYTYKNDYVELTDGGVQIVANQQELVSGDTLKLKMYKDERTNNAIDGCTDYTMWIDYAIVWLFVDKSAYAGIENFKLITATPEFHTLTEKSSTLFR